MQHPSVKKLFKEQAQYYSRQDQSAGLSPLIAIFKQWQQKQRVKKTLRVGEFGGAAGLTLQKIGQILPSAKLYNLELVEDYQKYQIHPQIKFVRDSILCSRLKDNFFDCLIIRDVLHHLVAGNFQKTVQNQKKALQELKRLVRPGGIVLIEELVERSAILAKIIYFFSRANSCLGFRVSFLEITPRTIVCFLTPKSLEDLSVATFGANNIIQKKYFPANEKWQERLVHFGGRSGKLVLMIKKTK